MESSPYVSVTTVVPTLAQRRWTRLRKASVKVGGGTLVGVGGVMMVTPLHPIGHAMAIGGIAALGKDSQGIEKAKTKIKDRFSRMKKDRYRNRSLESRESVYEDRDDSIQNDDDKYVKDEK